MRSEKEIREEIKVAHVKIENANKRLDELTKELFETLQQGMIDEDL